METSGGVNQLSYKLLADYKN